MPSTHALASPSSALQKPCVAAAVTAPTTSQQYEANYKSKLALMLGAIIGIAICLLHNSCACTAMRRESLQALFCHQSRLSLGPSPRGDVSEGLLDG